MRVMSTGRVYQVEKRVFTPKRDKTVLGTGEVGFVIAGIKEVDGAPVGDTLTLENRKADKALPGFRQVRPRVFAGLYPISSDDYDAFRDALQKLKLNDSALHLNRRPRRLWDSVSLRLPRHVAHGNRSGAPGTRIRSGLITTAPTVVYESCSVTAPS